MLGGVEGGQERIQRDMAAGLEVEGLQGGAGVREQGPEGGGAEPGQLRRRLWVEIRSGVGGLGVGVGCAAIGVLVVDVAVGGEVDVGEWGVGPVGEERGKGGVGADGVVGEAEFGELAARVVDGGEGGVVCGMEGFEG